MLALLVVVAGLGTLALAILRRRSAAHAPNWVPPTQVTLIALSIAAVTAATVFMLVAPVYASGRTLIEVNRTVALLPLLIPVVIAAVPALVPRLDRRTLACATVATILGIFGFVTGFSVGLLYVPAGALLVAAATVGLIRTPTSD